LAAQNGKVEEMKRGVRDLDTAAESRVRVEHAVGVLNEAAKTRHFKRRLALEPIARPRLLVFRLSRKIVFRRFNPLVYSNVEVGVPRSARPVAV
jgi:hypothetical protein